MTAFEWKAPRLTVATLLVLALTAVSVDAQRISPRLTAAAGASAVIDVTGHFAYSAGTRNDSSGYRATSGLVLNADSSGWLATSGPAVAAAGRMSPSTAAFAPDATTRIAATFALTKEGQYDGLRDTSVLRALVDSSMAPQLASMQDFPKQVRDGYIAAASIAALSARVEHAWWQLSGAFLSRSWSPGDSLSTPYTEINANMPGANIPLVYTLRYIGTVPCPTAQAGRRCWHFSAHTDMDMDGMRRAMTTLMTQMGTTDDALIAQIPIPQSSIVYSLYYDASTSRIVDATMNTTIESKGSTALKVAASTAHVDVHLQYRWSER